MYQDWEPVVLRRNKPEEKKKTHHDPLAEVRKIENEEKKFSKLALDMRQRLTQARIARGLTQAELAAKINMRPQIIHELESGKTIPMNEKNVLNKLQNLLKISLHFER